MLSKQEYLSTFNTKIKQRQTNKHWEAYFLRRKLICHGFFVEIDKEVESGALALPPEVFGAVPQSSKHRSEEMTDEFRKSLTGPSFDDYGQGAEGKIDIFDDEEFF